MCTACQVRGWSGEETDKIRRERDEPDELSTPLIPNISIDTVAGMAGRLRGGGDSAAATLTPQKKKLISIDMAGATEPETLRRAYLRFVCEAA